MIVDDFDDGDRGHVADVEVADSSNATCDLCGAAHGIHRSDRRGQGPSVHAGCGWSLSEADASPGIDPVAHRNDGV